MIKYSPYCILGVLLCLSLPISAQIQWQVPLGGSYRETAYAIGQTFDGGYIVAGTTVSNDGEVSGLHGGLMGGDYWVVKLSSSGSIQWQKCLGGSLAEEAYAVRQTADSGYIIAGLSNSNDGDVSGNHGQGDYWIVKLSATGTLQWQKSLGGSNDDVAKDIRQTPDGGYIVAGYTRSNDGDVSDNHGAGNFWIVKLSDTGDIQWQKCYGGSYFDVAHAIQLTADGGYIVAGSASSNDGDVTGYHTRTTSPSSFPDDYWVVKLTSSGSIEWEKALGGGDFDDAYAICNTTDGGYVVVGSTQSTDGNVTGHYGGEDYWVAKLSATGALQWQKCLGGSDVDEAYAVAATNDGGYIIAGASGSNDDNVSGNHGGQFDYWVVKISATGDIIWKECLGGINLDEARAVQQTTDGGYIVAGKSNSNDGDVTGNHGDYDFWVVKLGAKTGIDNITSRNTSIAISPNPTTGLIHISGMGSGSARIYNATGQLIKEVRNSSDISITECPTGVYFVTLCDEAGGNVYYGKVIKE